MNILKNYSKDESGNLAVIFALCLLPILVAVGVAVDLSKIVSNKQRLQDAADNAALAAIHEPNRVEARRVFRESLSTSVTGSEDRIRTAKFQRLETNNTVSVKATVKGKHSFAFGSLLGRSEIDYTVASSVVASKKISSVRFVPTFGSGYLNKEFGLWVIRPNSTTPVRLATYRWTSSAPVTFPNGASPGRLNSSTRGYVNLGNYTEFFMTTSITDPWNTYTREQMVEVYGEDFSLSSREEGNGDHYFVNGMQLAMNEQVNFTRDLSCSLRNQSFEWEDAPGLAAPGTDFRFRVETRCDLADPDSVRIDQ